MYPVIWFILWRTFKYIELVTSSNHPVKWSTQFSTNYKSNKFCTRSRINTVPTVIIFEKSSVAVLMMDQFLFKLKVLKILRIVPTKKTMMLHALIYKNHKGVKQGLGQWPVHLSIQQTEGEGWGGGLIYWHWFFSKISVACLALGYITN